jgi:hypothetical protein
MHSKAVQLFLRSLVESRDGDHVLTPTLDFRLSLNGEVIFRQCSVLPFVESLH